MQVWTLGEAGTPDPGDGPTTLDVLANLGVDGRQVRVRREHAESVIDDEDVATKRLAADVDNAPSSRENDCAPNGAAMSTPEW